MRSSVRRSPFLVTYWEGSTHWAYNYCSGAKKSCSKLVLAILGATNQWTGREHLRSAVHAEEDPAFDQTVDDLLRDRLLDSAGDSPSATHSAMKAWHEWNPAAGFFHSVTRGMRPAPRSSGGPPNPLSLRPFPFPAPLKSYPAPNRLELPAFASPHPLAGVLEARRTWRQFGERPVTVREIATLLGITFGVQRWIETGPNQWVPLKTSPSGGARHSIEAYLLSFGIEGLDCATYHYCPDSHALTRLHEPATRDLLEKMLPEQPGFHDAKAIIVMTSVFARVQWKYSHPHAYRVVLLDAGHLGQTFALVATALGLAPFCTAAVDSESIEQHLDIDGISEAPVLALGVGSRPDNKDWALKYDGSENPRTAPPAWAARFDSPH